MLAKFPEEVEADLEHYYHRDLADMYRGSLTVRKVAVLVLKLPRGAETWRAVGGRAAITAETESAWLIEHALYGIAHGQAGSKGKAPEFRAYPEGKAEADAKAAKAMSRAEAFREKQRQRKNS